MSQITSFYIVYSLASNCSYSYFLTHLFFNLFASVKWLTHYHVTVLEYSELDYILTFTSVLYFVMFSSY